jgi:hypothetical protein
MSDEAPVSDRPIIFSGPMVRAILDGRKTQTRRVIRHRHGIEFFGDAAERGDPSCWGWEFDEPYSGYMVLARGHNDRRENGLVSMPCPYGSPGGQLWVRETFCLRDPEHHPELGYWYAATDDDVDDPRWSPSIHMPRSASRITLGITSIRVQRLQDISEEDARDEGVTSFFERFPHIGREQRIISGELASAAPFRASFACMWDEIHESRAPWISNPWVWAISFGRSR